MSKITEHVGLRIRKCRKRRGYTIEEFSKMINKSKATLSKYENGSISIDIDTLFDISEALEMDLSHLINYKSSRFEKPPAVDNDYFNQSNLYLYYYDGRYKRKVRSVLSLTEPANGINSAEAVLYHNVEDFTKKEMCDNIYNGFLDTYDTTTHATLTNQINKSERIHFLLMNPVQIGTPATGLLTGIGNPPHFSPVAIKVILSKYVLEENEAFNNAIMLNKDDLKLFKIHNMMMSSNLYLSLKTK